MIKNTVSPPLGNPDLRRRNALTEIRRLERQIDRLKAEIIWKKRVAAFARKNRLQ